MSTTPHQHGGATLALALLLALLALLTAGFVHRGLVFEGRSAVNQHRATQAFESAEAGLEWALALLNRNAPVDDRCQPTEVTTATAFAEQVAHRLQAGQRVQAACVQGTEAWACTCPASGAATPPMGEGSGFIVTLSADSRPGQLRIEARGCHVASTCLDNASAHTLTQALVARLPGLSIAPAAALTVRGHADLRQATWGVHHPSGDGLTVHSGGPLDLGATRLISTPGAPELASVADHDAPLAALSEAGLFANVFHLDPTAWRDQPAAVRVPCPQACDDALAQALTPAAGHRLVWLEGGLHLNNAALLGTPQRPVVLVVNGPVLLQAPVAVHGLVYLRSAQWSALQGAQVLGAVVAEGDFTPQGPTNIHHDTATLEKLRTSTGSFARVPGSWRDF